jgi:hypothetical protein
MNPNQTAQGILEYFATYLAKEIEILGKYPPSNKLEVIDPSEFSKGTFKDGGLTFHRHGENKPRITELTVRKIDLNRAIRQYKRTQR